MEEIAAPRATTAPRGGRRANASTRGTDERQTARSPIASPDLAVRRLVERERLDDEPVAAVVDCDDRARVAEVRDVHHAVLEADLVKTFKGSPKRIYTAEEVEAEIDAALLDDRCPDWLEAQWKQAKNVGQRANLLGRVRAHFKSPEARPPRPVVDKTIYNTRDDPQVREYIQGTLSHPLIRTMRK